MLPDTLNVFDGVRIIAISAIIHFGWHVERQTFENHPRCSIGNYNQTGRILQTFVRKTGFVRADVSHLYVGILAVFRWE